MSRAYPTEDQKLASGNHLPWTEDECYAIVKELWSKGYYVNSVYRLGSDLKFHDAWQVERSDVPQLIEELFRQRLTVEVKAEGKSMASINFVYDYYAETVIEAVKRFRRCKE